MDKPEGANLGSLAAKREWTVLATLVNNGDSMVSEKYNSAVVDLQLMGYVIIGETIILVHPVITITQKGKDFVRYIESGQDLE